MASSAPATSLVGELVNAVFTGDSWKIAIPASLYVLQNSLLYFAISNLDTAVLQVTYQFKILPTALFSVVMLGRTLTPRKWLALALLMFGVAIVQLPASETASLPPFQDPHVGYHFPWSLGGFRGVGTAASAPLSKRSATYEGIQEDDALEHSRMNPTLGIAAALMGCVVSSLASVYFEKILKDAIQPVSLWVRNVQLAFYSMFPALFIGVFYVDGERIARNGFFAGYNWTVWSTLLLQAVGGMLVSLCVNYADNIAKTFAMGISILISLCASVLFFDFQMTRNFVLGTSVVLFATYLYNLRNRGSRPAPLRIHEYESTIVDLKSAKGRSSPLKNPIDPLKTSQGKSSSRPNSPEGHYPRVASVRGYFGSREAVEPKLHLLEMDDTASIFPIFPDIILHPFSYMLNTYPTSHLERLGSPIRAGMTGLSNGINKLRREMPGAGRNANGDWELLPTWSGSNAKAAFSNNPPYSMPYLANSRPLVSRDFFNQYPLQGPSADNEHYETPLDAFAVNSGTQNRLSLSKQISAYIASNAADCIGGPSFQTPPSQLLAEPSSPTYPPPSSPLAGVIQRREAQVSHPGGHVTSYEPPTSLFPSFGNRQARERAPTINQSHAPPIVQGIQLVSSHELPDRFRSVFPFPLLNAVQSKCYSIAYKTSDNLVVSAPTGSGKTAILELAICQLISGFRTDQFKIVYMAPTKSLCAERQNDWQAKFATLDLQCAELTGDTDQGHLRNVQNASIIITTPEKWDSTTRKWKDHAKLMELVKLFLIDEVHILKETRGACLEAVVSRMKSVGSNVRFIALSATVPNSEDIATWLGRNPTTLHLPAHRERFGEEFRPVKLQKHVYGLQYGGNDWGFDKVCDPKLPEIITKHSQKKPIMVFCITRKSTVSTAKLLANWWATRGPRERQWAGPTCRLAAQDSELKETLAAGVAFHHAGLEASDRHLIEKGFLEGQVNVICCTSTLAVGVNLPCHMVIVKNTMCFQEEGLKEYSDLEIMQMLGRAGRRVKHLTLVTWPQFEDSAVAVIITKQDKVQKYEKMVSGHELLESRKLTSVKNAEIGLGTIHDLHTAKRWLAGTFLYVRLGHNPAHYNLDGDATNLNLDDRIERICHRDVDLLVEAQLVADVGEKLKCTEFGDAMARYYVKFETMKGILSLEPRSKMSDILSVLVGAEEFRDVRYRAGEKKLLKDINGANGIKYPIKVDIALSQHKRSLVIQSELGDVEFPADEQFGKFHRQYQQDKTIIFNHIHRLIRCVIDCQIHIQDGVTVRHALELARSFAARVWDNSPYQLKQIPNIGSAAVRRLANGGINSIESLEASEPQKIEMLMSKHPPFGSKILASLKAFPKLRVSVKMMGKDVKRGQPVKIRIKAELGFLNEKVPTFFHRKAVHVCFLAERSDGQLIDFRRVSAAKLKNGQDILTSAELLQHTQFITCYVMCDEIAGTMRYAELKPDLPASIFQTLPLSEKRYQKHSQFVPVSKATSATSPSTVHGDERLYDDGVADEDIFEAVTWLDFDDVENFQGSGDTRDAPKKAQRNPGIGGEERFDHQEWAPVQLENGKWACNHKCKDKKGCKHLCCHEGIEKPPKAPKTASTAAHMPKEADSRMGTQSASKQNSAQTRLHLGKPASSTETNPTHSRSSDDYAKIAPRAYRSLHQLHEKVNKNSSTPVTSSTSPSFPYKKGEQPRVSFLSQVNSPGSGEEDASSDYGSGWMDDLPSPSGLLHAGKNISNVVHDEISSEAASQDCGLDFIARITEQQAANQEMGDHVDSTIFADDEYNEAIGQLGLAGNQAASQYFAAGSSSEKGKESNSGKLFLSTDSPEKGPSAVAKRKLCPSSDPQLDEAVAVPEAKRGKLDMIVNNQPSSKQDDATPPSAAPTIKPGHPDWVYEFDPAFVAEWEPYVEFV
ncbi:MAG: hypothetical protein L6R35_002340 [Caloplaca aegaea]|nr:MAG: hypothetical protein L6R35_002340 [Caloplaca aegaea]